MITAMLIGGERSGTVIQLNSLLKELKVAEPQNVATLPADVPVVNYKFNEVRYVLKQLTTGEYVYLKDGLQYLSIGSVLLRELEDLSSRLKKQDGVLIGKF